MQRLKTEKELDLLLPESEEKNIENFINILPYFYYDDETTKRVKNTIHKENRRPIENYLDEFFNLNDQRRAWYQIPAEHCVEHSEAYAYYRKSLSKNKDIYNIFTKLLKINETDKTIDTILDSEIFNKIVHHTETFITGHFYYNNQKHKLFKFLLKHKLLTQEEVDTINAKKVNDSKLYLCISRNPIDYLFCSTNQSFESSCLNLKSTHDGAYYMANAAFPLDPNRFIMFISNGKIKRYTIKGYEFKHFSYTQRSFGFISKSKKIIHVRDFPSTKYDFQTLCQKVGYYFSSDSNETLFSFKVPRYENGELALTYYDNYGWVFTENNFITGHPHRNINSCPTEFSWEDGFEDLESFDDLINGNNIRCELCDEPTHEDDMHFLDNFSICERCLEEFFVTCDECGELFTPAPFHVINYRLEGSLNITIDSHAYPVNLCENCCGPVCEQCGIMILDNNKVYDTDGGILCENCYNWLAKQREEEKEEIAA